MDDQKSLSQRDMENRIKSYLSTDESLYDLMCSLTSFELSTTNEEFNSTFFDGHLSQGQSLEIVYSSNNEKNPTLYYLLTELLYNNYVNSNEGIIGVEILFFDNYGTFDIIALYEMLLTKLGSVEEDLDKGKVVNELLKKLLIFRPLDNKEFLLNLKAFWNILDQNKFIRVVIIDSINSFQFFDDLKTMDIASAKDKRRNMGHSKKNFYKELNIRIYEAIHKIVSKEKLSVILFRKEYFKMSDAMSWDENKNQFAMSSRLQQILTNRLFANTRKIVLINNENINDTTFGVLNRIAKSPDGPLQRKPNLNVGIIKTNSNDDKLSTMIYEFGSFMFKILAYFEISEKDHYFIQKPDHSTSNHNSGTKNWHQSNYSGHGGGGYQHQSGGGGYQGGGQRYY